MLHGRLVLFSAGNVPAGWSTVLPDVFTYRQALYFNVLQGERASPCGRDVWRAVRFASGTCVEWFSSTRWAISSPYYRGGEYDWAWGVDDARGMSGAVSVFRLCRSPGRRIHCKQWHSPPLARRRPLGTEEPGSQTPWELHLAGLLTPAWQSDPAIFPRPSGQRRRRHNCGR